MSEREKEKKARVREYDKVGTRFQDYMRDLENPPYPDWKPQSYEWLREKAVDKTFWKYPPCPWENRVVDNGEVALYKFEVKVLEILGRGVCPHGHKPGDTFTLGLQASGPNEPLIKGSKPASELCRRARRVVGGIAYGNSFPGPLDYGRGEEENFMQLACCVCARNPVIFQVKRVKKEKPFDSKAPWMSIVKEKGREFGKEREKFLSKK